MAQAFSRGCLKLKAGKLRGTGARGYRGLDKIDLEIDLRERWCDHTANQSRGISSMM
jgi:hypothetical protein